MTQQSNQKPLNLNEWAYHSIKKRILDNEFKSGSQLNIEELSKELNISRTPIREALLRLRQNGFVVSFSNVGFFVCGITRDDFEDIFEMRQLIEAYAVVKFIETCTDDEIREVLDIHSQCVAQAKIENIKAFNDYDIQLHNMFINRLSNKKMRAVYDNVDDLLYRLRIYAIKSSENIKQSLLEHEKIMCAVSGRDSVAGKLAMEKHIVNIHDRIKPFVDFEGEALKIAK